MLSSGCSCPLRPTVPFVQRALRTDQSGSTSCPVKFLPPRSCVWPSSSRSILFPSNRLSQPAILHNTPQGVTYSARHTDINSHHHRAVCSAVLFIFSGGHLSSLASNQPLESLDFVSRALSLLRANLEIPFIFAREYPRPLFRPPSFENTGARAHCIASSLCLDRSISESLDIGLVARLAQLHHSPSSPRPSISPIPLRP